MSDWQPTGAPEVLDELVLADLDLLSEATHPVRGPMFRRLKTPRSAAELAESMDVPVTRLYHHLNRLEELGLIQVAATRRVGAATERRYQVVARSLTFDPDLFDDLDPHETAQVIGGLFDVAKLALQREVESGAMRREPEEDTAMVLLNELSVPRGARSDFMVRLRALLSEFTDADASRSGSDDASPDHERFQLFIAAHPIRSD